MRLTVTIACCQFIVLILHGGLLTLLHLVNLQFHLSNLRRNLCISQMYTRTYFVHCVDSLVGHEAVVDIAGCQFDTGSQSIVSIGDVVMIFVAVLDVVQNLQRLLVASRLYKHFLETALQGSILLDGVAVFVERRSTDALHGSACQRGLHDVGGIHRARR